MEQQNNNLNTPDKLIADVIPQNVISSRRVFGLFRKRNLIEALIVVIAVGYLICLIPFVTRVRLIFLACVCGSLGFLNLVGIKNQSITELIINYFKYLKQRGKYHLRPIGDRNIKQHIKNVGVTPNYNESIADRIKRNAGAGFTNMLSKRN